MSIKKEVTKELIKKHGSNEADSGSSASQVSILTHVPDNWFPGSDPKNVADHLSR